jgi:lipopolysaccharide export system protein LptA
MAASIPKLPLLTLLGLCAASHSAVTGRAAPEVIDFSAASSELDYKNKFVTFRKVKIVQGTTTITADQGQVNGTGSMENAFDDSRWVFHGAVRVTLDTGTLSSDEAQVTFINKQLATAVAEGKPSTFQQRIPKSDKTAKGEAEKIEYDAPKGIVHLIKNAWLSDGQNEVRGESLKYNMLAQTIAAEASEQNNQRVHIIIAPPAKPSSPPNP